MTDRIDLDECGADDDEADGPNPGDWFWRGEGDPDRQRTASTDARSDSEATDDATDGSAESATATADSSGARLDPTDPASGPVPRVPRENEDRPAGIPVESGGAGTGAGVDGGSGATADEGAASDAGDAAAGSDATEPEAAGPHGGGADDMTLAFTYRAATRLGDFGAAAADAAGWADWVGVVGRVPAHVLNKFQRDRNVDLDFFNGSARGPGERLAAVDRHSMFYAERMVVVGIEGEDEDIAGRADWEFVPLAEAAEKAGWELDGDGPERVDGAAGETGDSAREAGDPADGTDDAANGTDGVADRDGTGDVAE
ncbi:DUF7124 domain-containing protein [Halorussus sp. AFM4]|uniref:DUF7124 domain-containing protein n=1 Tax=Halorussus sp. AFM4 TaxID=3421651 RepID=UPI003EB6B04A